MTNYLFLSLDLDMLDTGTCWYDEIIQPVNTEKFNLGRTTVFCRMSDWGNPPALSPVTV